MSFTLGQALNVATAGHEGQTRTLANGDVEPYICHPIRVMAAVPRHLQMAAVLHDVLEDTQVSANVLYALGCPKPVVALIECLSRLEDETYEQFITRIIEFGIDAIDIKLADLRDNLAGITGTEWERHRPRYLHARERLEAARKESQ